jgi:hypothetical protein
VRGYEVKSICCTLLQIRLLAWDMDGWPRVTEERFNSRAYFGQN